MRYGIYESIQIVIDIACHLTAKYNLGNPKTYSECIELLKNHNYISQEYADTLTKMIGLKNLLAHEYIKIDPAKLFNFLENLEEFKKFISAVIEHI